jgi:hypothetical protein
MFPSRWIRVNLAHRLLSRLYTFRSTTVEWTYWRPASLEPLCRYLRDSGLDDATARNRAAAIDAFVLGVSTRRRVLRSELGDPVELQAWLAATIQRLADG